MHSQKTVATALRLVERGLNDCEVARRIGVPRPTVRDWRVGKLPHSFEDKPVLYGRPMGTKTCSQCRSAEHRFDRLSSAYVYLLGLYLGDGTISKAPKGVYKLRIFLDMRYPNIVAECETAMLAVLPYNKVARLLKPSNCYEVYAYSKAWPCLFPQHGPGMKHTRLIELTAWQKEFVNLVPELFLRGLIQSDGCRFTNTRGKSDTWSAPRYAFDNVSSDIRQIFCDTCDLLGLRWTMAQPHTIYISRKADVAKLDEFVGPKH